MYTFEGIKVHTHSHTHAHAHNRTSKLNNKMLNTGQSQSTFSNMEHCVCWGLDGCQELSFFLYDNFCIFLLRWWSNRQTTNKKPENIIFILLAFACFCNIIHCNIHFPHWHENILLCSSSLCWCCCCFLCCNCFWPNLTAAPLLALLMFPVLKYTDTHICVMYCGGQQFLNKHQSQIV